MPRLSSRCLACCTACRPCRGQSANSYLTQEWYRRLTYTASSVCEQALQPNEIPRLTVNYETGRFELLLPGTLDREVSERWSRSERHYVAGTDTSSGEKAKGSFASANFSGEAPREMLLRAGEDSNVYRDRRISWFEVHFQPTPFAVSRIRLTLDITRIGGWKQIDAAQLAGSPRAN